MHLLVVVNKTPLKVFASKKARRKNDRPTEIYLLVILVYGYLLTIF